MKIYFKLYLKLFLQTILPSIPIGILIGCPLLMMGAIFWVSVVGIDTAEWVFSHLNQGTLIAGPIGCLLLPSIVFSGMMSLGLGSFHIAFVKQISAEENENILNVHQTRIIQLSYPYRKSFELCTLSLKTLGNCEIRRTDRNQGTIEAKTGITWKTFGDIIWFKIQKLDDDTTQVEVSSKPAWRTAVVDYGENLENVEKIAAFLKVQ